MNLRRVAVLLYKELRGPKNFIFIMAVVVPVALTLVISLLFGTFLSERPRLGIVDRGRSDLPARAAALESIQARTLADDRALRAEVARGALDMGLVLPADFDARVAAGEPTELTVFVWGESLLRSRAILGTALLTLIRELAGRQPPVEVVTTLVGEAQSLPWEQRLLPFVVLMSLMLGGLMVPATSLVEEKQHHTLRAVTTTAATLGEVLAAKGLLGVVLSTFMAAVTLFLNRALGAQPALLVGTLAMGATLAAGVGLLLGVLVRDINSLFATIKSLGIFLYAPALVYMFPEIPAWIGRLFPTYYLIQPVIDIVQHGAGPAEVLPDLLILAGLIAALLAVVGLAGRRAMQRAG